MFNAEVMMTKHEIGPKTKTVALWECWSVVFDVNGNAPADAHVVACATKELAENVRSMFAAQRDGKIVGIIIGGLRHTNLPSFSVEGYDWDANFRVRADWQTEDKILRCLADLTEKCDIVASTDLPDGVVATATASHKNGLDFPGD